MKGSDGEEEEVMAHVRGTNGEGVCFVGYLLGTNA